MVSQCEEPRDCRPCLRCYLHCRCNSEASALDSCPPSSGYTTEGADLTPDPTGYESDGSFPDNAPTWSSEGTVESVDYRECDFDCTSPRPVLMLGSHSDSVRRRDPQQADHILVRRIDDICFLRDEVALAGSAIPWLAQVEAGCLYMTIGTYTSEVRYVSDLFRSPWMATTRSYWPAYANDGRCNVAVFASALDSGAIRVDPLGAGTHYPVNGTSIICDCVLPALDRPPPPGFELRKMSLDDLWVSETTNGYWGHSPAWLTNSVWVPSCWPERLVPVGGRCGPVYRSAPTTQGYDAAGISHRRCRHVDVTPGGVHVYAYFGDLYRVTSEWLWYDYAAVDSYCRRDRGGTGVYMIGEDGASGSIACNLVIKDRDVGIHGLTPGGSNPVYPDLVLRKWVGLVTSRPKVNSASSAARMAKCAVSDVVVSIFLTRGHFGCRASAKSLLSLYGTSSTEMLAWSPSWDDVANSGLMDSSGPLWRDAMTGRFLHVEQETVVVADGKAAQYSLVTAAYIEATDTRLSKQDQAVKVNEKQVDRLEPSPLPR